MKLDMSDNGIKNKHFEMKIGRIMLSHIKWVKGISLMTNKEDNMLRSVACD